MEAGKEGRREGKKGRTKESRREGKTVRTKEGRREGGRKEGRKEGRSEGADGRGKESGAGKGVPPSELTRLAPHSLLFAITPLLQGCELCESFKVAANFAPHAHLVHRLHRPRRPGASAPPITHRPPYPPAPMTLETCREAGFYPSKRTGAMTTKRRLGSY